MYLVSIYFDEKTTSRMQGYITQVAKRSGNPFMIEKNVPPHLTISAFETRSEDQVISLFEETRDMFQSGEIIWCSVGAFFPNVLYLSPVLNTYLQELSEKVYKELLKTAEQKSSHLLCVAQIPAGTEIFWIISPKVLLFCPIHQAPAMQKKPYALPDFPAN